MDFHNLLENLKNQSFFSNLIIERGIEKESLRVTKKGYISNKKHPETLGSSYTNPSITTDFAESLIEIVTPTYTCLLYTSPSPRDRTRSRMPSSA